MTIAPKKERPRAARNPRGPCRGRSRAGKCHVPCCDRQAGRPSRERLWRWRGESPALAAGSLPREPRHRRRARAQGRGTAAAPRAQGTAGHLAQRSWAASAAAPASGASNTFSLNFPAPVPANTHSRTHTRARAPGEPLRGERTGTGGSLAASLSLARSYWRGGYCFIYLFPPPAPPALSLPPSSSAPRSARPAPALQLRRGEAARGWRGLRRPGLRAGRGRGDGAG